MWFRDYHVDGLRLDAVHTILDTSPVHILEELSGKTAQLEVELGRQIVLIAENARKAVSEGRKRDFASFKWHKEDFPDPQGPATFRQSKLDWKELKDKTHRSMFEWYRQLIELRKSVAPFRDGRRDKVRATLDEEARWLCVERGPVTVVCNISTQGRWVPLAHGRPRNVILASTEIYDMREERIFLPPESLAVLGPDGEKSIE